MRDHYRPQGPGDAVPEHAVSQAVALADKLDLLVGFWLIDEKPTGSKDPYALRRAALGIIRIVLERGLKLDLFPLIDESLATTTAPTGAEGAVDGQAVEAVRLSGSSPSRGRRIRWPRP